jgi:hypothetical protein
MKKVLLFYIGNKLTIHTQIERRLDVNAQKSTGFKDKVKQDTSLNRKTH